jgi:uncharacterized protein (TIGR02001 family)
VVFVPANAPSRPIRGRHRCPDFAAFRGVVAIVLALACADARGQWSGSVSVVSDYRYRGISLTGNDPAVQGAINYDDRSGFYAGSFLSNVRFAFASGQALQALSFAGYVWQLPSGVSGEVGVDYSFFTRTHGYDYPEVYAGFSSGNFSGRLYYTPRYFGRFGDAIYGEINFAQPLGDRVRIVAHGGALRSKSYDQYGGSSDQSTFDGRLGIGFDIDAFNLELSWVGVSNAESAYPFAGSSHRNGVVFSVSRSF